ncbi:MAG: hypothetical protein JWN62_3444 [Acidimicrobiales bacterium]|nr:hypothetical protein [Acidimicrobiales bacterium]
MSTSATRDEIRVAYRRLARANHPDTKGEASAIRMAQINESWRVLSDPARRAMYDAQSRGSSTQRAQAAPASGSAAGGEATTTTTQRVVASASRDVAPARFPWRFMLCLAAAGIAFILVNAALTKPSPAEVPDNLINAGSCVDVAQNGDAVEVTCDGQNDGVVVSLIASDAICPQDTEGHRDHQGMGQVCMRRSTVNG